MPLGNRTLTFLGASGVGKSTLVNALLGNERQATSAVREGDQRGRHTTVAAELVPLPRRGLADRHARRPGAQSVAVGQRHRARVRRRVRPDGQLPVPRLQARPGTGLCGAGGDRRRRLDPVRLRSLDRLVEEEAALEEEQRARDKIADKRVGWTDPAARAERVRRVGRAGARPCDRPSVERPAATPTGSRTWRR